MAQFLNGETAPSFVTLTATVSFRLTEDERRTLELRADREQRTVSQLVRLLLRHVLQLA
jgi:hypothetical protein